MNSRDVLSRYKYITAEEFDTYIGIGEMSVNVACEIKKSMLAHTKTFSDGKRVFVMKLNSITYPLYVLALHASIYMHFIGLMIKDCVLVQK